MDLKNVLENNENEKIKALYNNLILKGKLSLEKFFLNSDSILKGNIYYIKNIINVFINVESFKAYSFLRNINYLNNTIISKNLQANFPIKYKISNHEGVKKNILLFYIIIYIYQIYFQNKKRQEKSDYLMIKKLYDTLKNISSIVILFYINKLFDIEELEVIFKMLILFSINNYSNLDIKENNDIKNIMYLKECLKIIKIIFKKDCNKEEENFLINIFKYINNNICYIDKQNTCLNYTNKFYMLNNDYKTTKLIGFMNFIHKINNTDLNNIYFELLSNIYYFQFTYSNLFGQFINH